MTILFLGVFVLFISDARDWTNIRENSLIGVLMGMTLLIQIIIILTSLIKLFCKCKKKRVVYKKKKSFKDSQFGSKMKKAPKPQICKENPYD
jgi:hypothetical protein